MDKASLDVKTASTRYGELSFYAKDSFIGYALERYGEYSEAEVDLFRQLIKPGDTVVEVGANIGALTLPLAKLVGPEGRVLAFEPQPDSFQLLLRNLRQNDLTQRIVAHRVVVSDKGGCRVKMPKLAELGHDNYGGVEVGSGSIDVQTVTLDAMSVHRIHLLKVDVEGMEAVVIRGAHKLIMGFRPVLYVENDRAEKSDELLALIRSMEYRIYEHRPPIFNNPKNFNSAEVLEKDAALVSLNLLCIPKEMIGAFPEVTGTLTPAVPTRPSGGKKNWVCIARLGGIGDDLIAASVLRPLKNMGFMVEVLTQEPQACVFENNPFIDKLAIHTVGDLPADFGEWTKWFRGRAVEYERLVNLSHSVEGLLALFDGSVAFSWPAAYRRKMCGASYLETAHDIVGVPHEFGPLFFPTDEEKEKAAFTREQVSKGWSKPVVGWCLSGSRLDKLYPASTFAVQRLIKEVGAAVVMVGAPGSKDFDQAQIIYNHVKASLSSEDDLHLALSPEGQNSWPLRRSMSLLLTCDLVITPDTGLGWAVAMEPMPKIVLMSHASDTNITKHWVNTKTLLPDRSVTCWPCHKLHNIKDTCEDEQRACGMTVNKEALGAACISSIKVEDILSASREFLK